MNNENFDERRKRKTQTVWWYIAVAMSEAVGTGILIFLGCSSAVPSLTPLPPSHMSICLVFGFAVAIIIQMFGHVSGAHLNPAVTVAACVMRLVPVSITALYFVAQIVGGLLGYASILLITPRQYLYGLDSDRNVTHAFCTTVPSPNISTFQALLVEYFSTAILVLVCCGVWDKRNEAKHDSAPIKFGIAITGIALAMGPYSGGSMNPARSFAPAIFTGVWNSHWIYWVGPLSSALLTSFFYKYIFERRPPEPELDPADVPLNQMSFKVRNSDKISESQTVA